MNTLDEIADKAVKRYENVFDVSLFLDQRIEHLRVARIAAEIALKKAAEGHGDTAVGQSQSGCASVAVAPGYTGLLDVLVEALNQAQYGKGAERHNLTGKVPFERQRMQLISELIGSVDGMAYQACKKITEGVKLPTLERQVAELLGAIVYIAGMIVFLRNQQGREHGQAARAQAAFHGGTTPEITRPSYSLPG